MSTEPLALEVADESPLSAAVAPYQLEAQSRQACLSRFQPLFAEAGQLIDRAKSINITAASTPTDKKLVKTLRLALKDVRCRVESERKTLKEDSLRRGKAIDAMATLVKCTIEPVEQHLEDQEKFEERQEAARKAALKAEREIQLAVYKVDTTFFSLGEMSRESFDQLLDNTKLAHQQRLDAQRKAEEDRIRQENERLAREKAMREENERLKKEAEEREAKAAAERKAAEEAARAERERVAKEKAEAEAKAAAERAAILAEAQAKAEKIEKAARVELEAAAAKAKADQEAAWKKANEEARAREKAEAEVRAARESEARRIADAAKAESDRKAAEELARQTAAKAPDRVKISAFAQSVRALQTPDCVTDAGRAAAASCHDQAEKFALWIENKASTI
jgi:hypothetical protein